MVKSMTGFGRAETSTDSYWILVEMKSVNHRFCEINIRMPKQLLSLEDKIKKAISAFIKRGRVEVFITIEGQGLAKKEVTVDWNLLSEYIQSLKQVKDRFQISSSIQINDILQLENVFTVIEEAYIQDELEDALLNNVHIATEQLLSMRTIEGAQLQKDILDHVSRIEKTAHELHTYAPIVVEAYRLRLEKKMKDFVGTIIDEQRLISEAAIFSDKADINEELKRIHSHIVQFTNSLESMDAIGRKLDFLVQELNREVNTIGSKANDAKIANSVVEMKACIEKIKEQVQNIE
ncbi:YicC/YloC family endoribonuclease [Sutcliffiella halmapala]|uniref:YicC/YloC family endoribonuclease n=1 Tax=Sutcliffiella halmapala TaxID=79882 RepID=UPI000994FB60|nr:YicC/YloC family endoribonuclease [Sutcliffiella halmapala]